MIMLVQVCSNSVSSNHLLGPPVSLKGKILIYKKKCSSFSTLHDLIFYVAPPPKCLDSLCFLSGNAPKITQSSAKLYEHNKLADD